MKLKRVLSVLLACLMLAGVMTVGASAAEWKKTEGKYTVPWIGRYLAWPGEMLITKLLLPRLLGGISFDILGDAFTDANVNSALASTATDLEDQFTAMITGMGGGAALAPLGGKFPAGTLYYVFADDAPATVKTNTTLAANITTGVTWNATTKAAFIDALCVVLRPAIALQLGADIVNDFDTVYAPGLKALGAANLPSKADLQAKLAVFGTKASGFASATGLMGYLMSGGNTASLAAYILNAEEKAAADAITRAVVVPILEGLDKLGSTDIATLLFKDLPNLLYGIPALDALLATDFAGNLLGGLGFTVQGGFGGYIESMLGDALADYLPGVDIGALLEKIKYAGDLVDGVVVADSALIYNILVNFIYENLNKDTFVPLLSGLLGDKVPNFVAVLLFYLIKALAWFLYL